MKDKINDLVIELLKTALGNAGSCEQERTEKQIHKELIGKYVICRTYSAGVHTGVLANVDENHALLRESRRLWRWKSEKSGKEVAVALSAVAQYGLEAESRADVTNPDILINGWIELIPCSPKAEKSIREYQTQKD